MPDSKQAVNEIIALGLNEPIHGLYCHTGPAVTVPTAQVSSQPLLAQGTPVFGKCGVSPFQIVLLIGLTIGYYPELSCCQP